MNTNDTGYIFAPWLPLNIGVPTLVNPYKDEEDNLKSMPLNEELKNKTVPREYYEVINVDNLGDNSYNSENYIG